MLPESPEYEPIMPVVCSEISILKVKIIKEIMPTANNKANAANEIINPLSSFRLIYEHLQFVFVLYRSLRNKEYKIRCPFFRTAFLISHKVVFIFIY